MLDRIKPQGFSLVMEMMITLPPFPASAMKSELVVDLGLGEHADLDPLINLMTAQGIRTIARNESGRTLCIAQESWAEAKRLGNEYWKLTRAA